MFLLHYIELFLLMQMLIYLKICLDLLYVYTCIFKFKSFFNTYFILI